MFRGHPGGDRELVAEVERALGTLAGGERLHQRDESVPHPLRLQPPPIALRRLGPLSGTGRCPVEQLGERRGVGADRRELDEVLAELAGERENVAGDGGGHPVDVQVVRPGADHPVGELPGTGAAEQPRPGLGRQAEGVLADQAPGVGVVGGDRRLAGQHGGASRAGGVEIVE